MRLPIINISALRRMKFGLVLAGLVAWVGCSDGKIARYPVHGSVNIDGKAADGVMVIFCPVGGSEAVQKTRPFGFTGSDGKFELTTLQKGDGAPAGDYKVLAQWPTKSSTAVNDGGRSLGGDRLQGRYLNL